MHLSDCPLPLATAPLLGYDTGRVGENLTMSPHQSICPVDRAVHSNSIRFCPLADLVALTLIAVALTTAATAQSTLVWQQVDAVRTLPPRAYFASAYDPVSKFIILFGGYNNYGQLDETWLFDGQNWEHLVTYVHPSARASASMVYDAKVHKLVMFGGYNGANYLNDTWLFDGKTLTWTQAFPTTVPPAVAGPMLFSDPVNGHADMFGGFDGNFFQETTWRWGAGNWHHIWTTNLASARGWAVAATNPVNQTTVIFGGVADVRPDTWTFDGKDWTQQSFSGEPPYFSGSPGYFDPQLGQIVALGGGQNQTWSWDGSAWTQLSTLTGTFSREGVGTVWDDATGEFLIFGGLSPKGLMGDVWQLTPE